VEYPKKLIEVALPLDDINKEAAREKSIRHGHPSTLHLWWARRPLAAARAVLFAQLVNDPGGKRGYGAYRGQTKDEVQKERERLFNIIRELVKWENIDNCKLLEKARTEIKRSWEETCKITGENPSKMPAFHDPFAGGGTIPLEAQRLGLEAYASDLNPIAVLINKATIEIPPKFTGQFAVNPETQKRKDFFKKSWHGNEGLAEDVQYYGKWIRNEAEKRIGHMYPKYEITSEMIKERPDLKLYKGKKLNVIAWIWARTVKSPSPGFANIEVPLATTFILSTKKGKEAYVEPIIKGTKYQFTVKIGKTKNDGKYQKGTKFSKGSNFQCLISKAPISGDYVKAEGKAGRLGQRLIAVIAEGGRDRVFLPPTPEHEKASKVNPLWSPDVTIVPGMSERVVTYGFFNYSQLFSSRQLLALTTFADMVSLAYEQVKLDALAAGLANDNKGLKDGGSCATAYAEAIAIYLAFAVDYASNYWSTIATPAEGFIRGTFSRQSLVMSWDFAEAPPFGSTSGNWLSGIEWIKRAIINFPSTNNKEGSAVQADASKQKISIDKIISTDPPYYDNIGYAELSDFFYIWLRRSLNFVFPDIFATLTTPKTEELISAPHRHGSKVLAELFFLNGMTQAMNRLANQAHAAFPVTIYYAFKQSEKMNESGIVSTGWETFLDAVIRAGFKITGTWPMRTEREGRTTSIGNNALASSIILVCRKKENAPTISRKDFLRELKSILPEALDDMIGGKELSSPIAPVDLAQAAIGPGMAIFSKCKAVVEADGTSMSVNIALGLINKAIDEYFTEAEGEMDEDTRFCVDWFQQYGFKDGVFGEADVLARAKGASVEGVQEAGVITAKAGKVRLLKVSEYPQDWDPQTDNRVPIWEACHHMCRALQISETRAGELLAKMPEKAEAIRQLAYRLYTLCERKGWAEDAGLYNGLIASWHAILDESHKIGHKGKQQTFFNM